MSIRKNASIASIAIFFSRLMGLVREMVFAGLFGAGPVLDAFVTAFRIPNLLRELFAEGALSSSFLSVFTKTAAKEGDEKSFELANQIFGFLILVVGSITVLGILFSPQIVSVLASGFSPEKQNLTIQLNRLLFPFILLITMASVSMAILNSKGQFALPQSASTFSNITSIVTGLGLVFIFEPQFFMQTLQTFIHGAPKPDLDWGVASNAIIAMAIGTLAGGLVQWLVQMPSLYNLGYRFKPNFHFRDKNLKTILVMTLPAIIGGSAVQINVLINTHFASFLPDGSISYLNFAFRLMLFPLGLFGAAVASASAPELSRLVATDQPDKIRQTLRQSLQLSFLLCIPSTLGLVVLAKPILALIYQHGHFSEHDTLEASHALIAYAAGLLFYSMIKIYQPAFIAFGKVKTTMWISILSMGLNLGLSWLFIFKLEFAHWGLAMSTSVVAMVNAVLLTFTFRKLCPLVWTKKLVVPLLKIVPLSVLAILSAIYVSDLCLKAAALLADNLIHKMIFVFVPITLACGLFLGLGRLFKIEEILLLEKILKSRSQKA